MLAVGPNGQVTLPCNLTRALIKRDTAVEDGYPTSFRPEKDARFAFREISERAGASQVRRRYGG